MSASGPQGVVYLVGAGPGDPKLVTVRGAELLRRADVVVYDSLSPRELLELAPAHAERIDVGKRGHGPPTRDQQEIEALLVARAREGKRVVRLKGGDPFVFGRGGEEASACHAAGVPFEVVPGVSSAIGSLAYAGIPVTDRRHASSFTVVTGHKDPTPSASATRWREIATGADTLIVLMGMRNVAAIVERLLEHGRSPDTPSAAVMLGSTPRQRVVTAPLRELPGRAAEAGIASPSAVVVGDVVRLRPELAWFEALPLFGLRVLVTRAEAQSHELAERLRAEGAEPVVRPMIQVAPEADLSELDECLGELDAYDAVLFTSRNAVRVFAARRARAGAPPATLRPSVLCVGPATAREALRHGLPVQATPGERFEAEALLQALTGAGSVAGRRYLFPCAAEARQVLPEGLRAAGAHVDAVPVYRTRTAPVDAEALRRELREGALDALTFASPSAVRHFLGHLDEESRVAARRCTVVAIGDVTARALGEHGLSADAVAEQAGSEGLVRALIRSVAARAPAGPP